MAINVDNTECLAVWNNRIADLVTSFGAILRSNLVKYLGTLMGQMQRQEMCGTL